MHDAVEKANENHEEHGNCNSRKKRNLTANGRQEVKLGSQKPPKDGHESQMHALSNALLHFSARKVEIVLILPQKENLVFVKFDHELARTSELDV